ASELFVALTNTMTLMRILPFLDLLAGRFRIDFHHRVAWERTESTPHLFFSNKTPSENATGAVILDEFGGATASVSLAFHPEAAVAADTVNHAD
ncbi:MAG: hypothetical protein WEA31_02985, partial [Pirellulales bacterium]